MDNLYSYGGTGARGFFYGVNTLTQIASNLVPGPAHHRPASAAVLRPLTGRHRDGGPAACG